MSKTPATPGGAPREAKPPRRLVPPRLAPLLLALAVGGTYSNVYRNSFVFDDRTAVVENPNIRRLWPLTTALWAPPDTPVSGRPLASLLLAVNYAIGKLEPWDYHATGVGLHLSATLLLWALLRKYLNAPPLSQRIRQACEGLALSIALLWSLHPMLMECVAYVSARSETLMSLWYLATLYAAARAAERPRSAWPVLCVLCSAAGMLSKESMASAPLLVLIADGILLYPSWRTAWRQRWPLYAGLAATWLILLALVATNPRGKSVSLDLPDITPAAYLLTQLGVIVHYVRLAFWPAPLSLDYSDWPIATSFKNVALPGALLAVAGVAALVALARRRPIAVAAAVFFLVLAPSSSVIPIASEIASERRMYLPLAALLTVSVCAIHAALRGLLRSPAAGTRVAVALLLLAGGAFGVVAHQRAHVLRTELALWQDEVSKRPSNARAHNNLGYQFSLAGRWPDAAASYRKAVTLSPQYGQAWTNLGAVLSRLGLAQNAAEAHRRALELAPGRADRQLNFGAALRQAGRLQEAENVFRHCVEANAGLADARVELGRLLLQTNRPAEAQRELARAAALRPDDPDILDALADALVLTERKPEAVRCLERIVILKPASAAAAVRLGAGYYAVGRDKEAAGQLRRALTSEPQLANAHYLLSLVLERQGERHAARAEAEQAARLESSKPESPLLPTYQAQLNKLQGEKPGP